MESRKNVEARKRRIALAGSIPVSLKIKAIGKAVSMPKRAACAAGKTSRVRLKIPNARSQTTRAKMLASAKNLQSEFKLIK